MQESTMASTKKELQDSQMVPTEHGMGDEVRHPSINTEPRTLDEMNMESAMIAAQKIYAEHPSEDFTKDAVDTATRENSPAEDAGDANPLGTHLEDLVQEAGDTGETTSTPAPTPAM